MSTIERSGNLVHDYTVGIEKARKQIGRRVVLLFAKNPEIQYVVTLAAAGTMWSWCLWNKDSVDLYDPYEDKTYQPNQGRSAPTSTTRHQDDEEQRLLKLAFESPPGTIEEPWQQSRYVFWHQESSGRSLQRLFWIPNPFGRLDSGGSPMSSAPPTDIDAHSDTSSEPEGDKNDSDYPWHDQPESASHSNVPSAQVDNPSDSPVNSPVRKKMRYTEEESSPKPNPSLRQQPEVTIWMITLPCPRARLATFGRIMRLYQPTSPATEQYLKYMAEAGRIIKEVGPLHKIWKSGKWSPPYCGWCPKAKDYKHKEAIQEFWAAFCLCEPKFLAEILKCRDEVAAQAYHW
ncbi:hypothetical protein C8Q70DRAFT_934488 [Cubamyces menziesii]|nr:hypothetical protein C8Q70DRAFT_934488 [Cubamyces menziesii]